jgi:hypothetical protein
VFVTAAALIHVSAAVDHRSVTVLLVGFLVAAALQTGLAALLLWRRPPRAVLLAGVALMVASVALWVLSRTEGLPFVPGGHQEPIGVEDGITKLFELAAIPGLLLLTSREIATMSLPSHRLATQIVSLAGAGAFVLMVPALILAGGHDAGTDGGEHLRTAGHGDAAADRGHPGGGGSAHAGGAAALTEKAGAHGRRSHRARRHRGRKHAAGAHTLASGHAAHGGAQLAVLHRHGSGAGAVGHHASGGSGSAPGGGHQGHGRGSGRSGGGHSGHEGHNGNGSGNGGAPSGGGSPSGPPPPSDPVEALVRPLTGIDPTP